MKKAKPENVNFAKKAKRVDVKRLKDDIWSGLKVLVPEAPSDDSVSCILIATSRRLYSKISSVNAAQKRS